MGRGKSFICLFFKRWPISFLLIIAYTFSNQSNDFLYMLLFIFLHEIGHLITGALLGIKILEVEPSIVGFRAELDTYKNSNWKNLITYMAGPFVNFILVLIRNSN